MTVCYDLRFPELFRILALRGARVLALPAAFTLATTRDHWEVLLRARAIENQCFVVAANQIGEHPGQGAPAAARLIVDPWGTCSRRRRTPRATRSPSSTSRARTTMRARLPALAHRRPRRVRVAARELEAGRLMARTEPAPSTSAA